MAERFSVAKALGRQNKEFIARYREAIGIDLPVRVLTIGM
jgi:hypothetical protein